jgi:hypothetical protein
MNMTAFWDIGPKVSLKKTDVPVVRTTFVIKTIRRPDDGGNT